MIGSILEQRASLMSQAGIVLTVEAVSGFEQKRWNMEPEVVKGFMDIAPLETMVQTDHLASGATDRRWVFSPDIFATENFRDTCESQPQKPDFYKKEILFVLMIRDEIKDTLKCLVMTPEEAIYVKKLVSNPDKRKGCYMWIETVHQTVFCGEKPTYLIASENYRSLLEQLALANGDMDILLQALNISEKANWFLNAWDSKMDFVERCILPLHKDKPNLSAMLKKMAFMRHDTEVMPTQRLVFHRAAVPAETQPVADLAEKQSRR